MKKVFYLFLCLAFAYNATAQNQARFIPANSFIVTEFNLKSLYEKGNLNEIKKLEIFQMWERESAREFQDNYEAAKVMWNDPAATGADLNGFAYYFIAHTENQDLNPYFGVIIPVKNMATMEDFIVNKLDLDKGKKVEKVGKMKAILFRDGALIWGGDAILFVYIPNNPAAEYPDYNETLTEKEREKRGLLMMLKD